MEKVKERPILFSGKMVKAILEGRKTQTRRVVTRDNVFIDGGPAYKKLWDALDLEKAWIDPGPSPAGNPGPYLQVPNPEMETTHRIYSKLLAVDQLWVRETFSNRRGDDSWPTSYKADEKIEDIHKEWKPSIHMPRWASRINLLIKEIRVERLQDITKSDAMAEGVTKKIFQGRWGEEHGYSMDWSSLGSPNKWTDKTTVERDICLGSPQMAFANLWNKINKKRGFGWDYNPWVWVIEFERVRP